MAQHKTTDAAQIKAIWKAMGFPAETAPSVLTLTVAKAEEIRKCECGCDGDTARKWVPGHDAKHKSRLFALARGTDEAQRNAALAELAQRDWPLPSAKAGTAPKPLPLPVAEEAEAAEEVEAK